MDTIKCEAFITAAESGSLTAAAESLGYTQSGITRMIRSLEDEVGFPLFVRTKKGVTLTENGKSMLPMFREIVRAQQNAEQLSADICGIVKGVLTVGSYFSVSANWIPSILNKFRSLYPDIKIRMQEGGNREMSCWLNERSVDCCFCAEPQNVECDWIPVFKDEIVMWLHKNHPMANAKAFPIERLATERFIHLSPNHDTEQDRLLNEMHIHPNTCFTTRDGFTTYNMVAAGLGVSFNQRLISQKWDDSVVKIPFAPAQYVSLGIGVPSLKDLSPAARRFIDCARDMIQNELSY